MIVYESEFPVFTVPSKTPPQATTNLCEVHSNVALPLFSHFQFEKTWPSLQANRKTLVFKHTIFKGRLLLLTCRSCKGIHRSHGASFLQLGSRCAEFSVHHCFKNFAGCCLSPVIMCSVSKGCHMPCVHQGRAESDG